MASTIITRAPQTHRLVTIQESLLKTLNELNQVNRQLDAMTVDADVAAQFGIDIADVTQMRTVVDNALTAVQAASLMAFLANICFE